MTKTILLVCLLCLTSILFLEGSQGLSQPSEGSHHNFERLVSSGDACCPEACSGTCPCACNPAYQLSNQGGPVLSQARLCPVYLSAVPDNIQYLLPQYITNVLQDSSYLNGLTQYNINNRPVLHPSCVDGIALSVINFQYTAACTYPGKAGTFPCISESNLRTIINNDLRSANPQLPAPDTGSSRTVYLIYFGPASSFSPVPLTSEVGDCYACGVHTWTPTNGTLKEYYFATFPDFTSSACQNACYFGLPNALQAAMKSTSSEVVATLTNPQSEPVNGVSGQQGWIDVTRSNEITDACNNYHILVGDSQPVTPYWSNHDDACVSYSCAVDSDTFSCGEGLDTVCCDANSKICSSGACTNCVGANTVPCGSICCDAATTYCSSLDTCTELCRTGTTTCGLACCNSTNQLCYEGACFNCAPGLVACDDTTCCNTTTHVCSQGTCVASCPQGTTECGSTCCAPNQRCNNGNTCVASCAAGTFNCGNFLCCNNGTQRCNTFGASPSCASNCLPGLIPCGSTCCSSSQTCNANGQCITPCPTGLTRCGTSDCCTSSQVCSSNGTCVSTCPQGTSKCGTSVCCADATSTCQAGSCVGICPGGAALCGGFCCGTNLLCNDDQCVSACPSKTTSCGAVCCDSDHYCYSSEIGRAHV